METMYQAQPLFDTTLDENISDTQTTIKVTDLDKFPDETPNLATIIDNTTEDLETIKYTGKDETNSELTGVTRGIEGTAKSWDNSTQIGRYHTAVEQNTVIDNIETLDSDLNSHIGSGGTAHDTATTSVHGFMSSSDKSKLDGIDDNANNYSLETHGNEYHDENYTTYDSSDFDNDFDGANISRLNNDSGYTTYTFSEDYQDLSNRTHGNEDHTSTFYSSGDSPTFNHLDLESSDFGMFTMTRSDYGGPIIISPSTYPFGESSSNALRFRFEGTDRFGMDSNGVFGADSEIYENGNRVATRTWTDSNYTSTSPSDVNSSNWGDYEIQKNGTDGSGIINFKT